MKKIRDSAAGVMQMEEPTDSKAPYWRAHPMSRCWSGGKSRRMVSRFSEDVSGQAEPAPRMPARMGERLLGRIAAAGEGDGGGGAAEGADGGGLFAGVAEPLAGEGLLDLEHGVDAFGIDDEGWGGAVAAGQILVEQCRPAALGGGAGGGERARQKAKCKRQKLRDGHF